MAGELSLLDRGAFRGRLWATRRRPWVDRLASAWLIRRFIDDEARFLWLAAPETCPATAVGFDFDGAPFSHVGTLVTFEVLVAFCAGRGDPRQSGTVDPLPGRRWGTDPGGGGGRKHSCRAAGNHYGR